MNPNNPQDPYANPTSPDPVAPPQPTFTPEQPAATLQPAMTAPQAPPPAPQPTSDPGKVLGILGLILGFVGLSLIGLILAIVAKVKSSKAGFKNTLAVVAIVLNSLFILLAIPLLLIMLTAYNGVQSAAKDSLTYTELSELNKGLAKYIREKSAKPASLQEVATFANIDSVSLTDEDGKPYTLSWQPEGCATLVSCTAFTLSGDSSRHKGEKISISYSAITGQTTYENKPGSSTSK